MSQSIDLGGFLSDEQRPLALRVVRDRPHLIRGVQGSGKTTVLAYNLAVRLIELDRQNPPRQPRIAVLCFNRCLVPLIVERTAKAYERLSGGRAFDPRRVMCVHMNGFAFRMSNHPKAKAEGWGGPLTYRSVSGSESDAERRALDYIRQLDRLSPVELEPYLFDTIYIDEGQDFTEAEIKLLLRLMRPAPETNEKNLIVFYDNAQNIYARKAPVWSSLGVQMVGRSDVMKRCMRNTAEVVDLSFNVLVGPEHSRTGTRQFADLDTLRRDRLIDESSGIIRSQFTARHGDAPIVTALDSEASEQEWVIAHIDGLISSGTAAEEILVIAPHRDLAERMVRAIERNSQWVDGIACPHLPTEKDLNVRRPGHIIVTTPESAKGYDAEIVFVIRSEEFSTESASRAAFYVACTRSKEQLLISGVGRDRGLLAEALTVSARLFPNEGDLPCPTPPPPRAAVSAIESLQMELEQLRAELAERNEENGRLIALNQELEERNRELERRTSQVVAESSDAPLDEVRSLRAMLAETEQMWSAAESRCDEYKSETKTLQSQLERTKFDLEKSEEQRQWSDERYEKSLRMSLDSLLPNLSILPQSWKAMTQVGFELDATLEVLGSLNADLSKIPPRATNVKAASDWYDLHVNSGKSDDGRVYFSKVNGHGRREVLIGRKREQRHQIEVIKGRPVR